nr:linker for activation of T-cells family member 2 isoform X1 [Dasypus novemcinctus]XP_058141927.1 linker for activation of T-cells family member 2 isoform X1 [Dasypus novemcinctus]XP_058141928.1 linker for activation of T-cells family member 2 isoform X1 [Dasypus novemcinctus]
MSGEGSSPRPQVRGGNLGRGAGLGTVQRLRAAGRWQLVLTLALLHPSLSLSPVPCPWGDCGLPGTGSAQPHVFPGTRINRALQWPGPIRWSGRCGQIRRQTRPLTRGTQGRTSYCSSHPAWRIPQTPDTRTSAKEANACQMRPTCEWPSPAPCFLPATALFPHPRRDPIPVDCHQWGQFQKPLEDDDDANSYENVLICKQRHPESGDEGSADYQNSASIRQWRESPRAVELVLKEAPQALAGSPDDDGEPDYVNGDMAGAAGVA